MNEDNGREKHPEEMNQYELSIEILRESRRTNELVMGEIHYLKVIANTLTSIENLTRNR